MPPDDVDDYDDPTEAIRLAIIGLGLVLNVAMVYWQVKDTAEMIELRAKIKAWWDRKVAAPARARKTLQRAEAETVYEAITIVEEAGA